MSEQDVDEIDRRILNLLQEDARNNTNAEISERVDVSPSTIGNRIKQLESGGVIIGYQPFIDYSKAGYPLRVLFVCTATVGARASVVQRIREIHGVVNVRELMTGERNVHVEVVGSDDEDVTRLATTIDDTGVVINEEVLVKSEFSQPASVFDAGGMDER